MAEGNGFSIADDAPEPPKGRGGGRGQKAKDEPGRRDAMAALLDRFKLWRGQDDGEPYASAGGEHYPVPSPGFADALSAEWYRATGQALSGESLNALARLARARALADGLAHAVWRRWAAHDGTHYLDLGGANPKGERRCVCITAAGWSVLPAVPDAVRFLRAPDAQPMPAPAGGDETKPVDLCGFLNIAPEDPDSLALAWAWLLCAAFPAAPGASYPLAVLAGQQGSGKTSAARWLQRLIDPSSLDGRGLPKEERDLFVSAERRHVTFFDNLSAIAGDFSDALCRIATGGGFAVRALHTDRGEVVFSIARPIITTGIDEVLLKRADLAERALVFDLRVLPEPRRTDAEMREAFAQAWPALLGLLCDGIAAALRTRPATHLANPPRMADAATWAAAGMGGLRLDAPAIIEGWHVNRVRADATALEGDDLALAIRALVEARGPVWSGSPTALLGALAEHASATVQKEKAWPKTASALGQRLRRLAPSLRRAWRLDVARTKGGHDSDRTTTLRKL